MISFLAKYKRVIFTVVVVVFVGSTFFFSGQIFTSSSADALADVGGKKIPYRRFSLQVNRVLSNFKDSGTEVNEVITKSVKQEIFRDMVIEELLSQQGDKMAMRVPDFEVAVEIQNTPQFTENGAFSYRRYAQTIFSEFQMSPSDYEVWRKQARLAGKFKQFLLTNVKVTPAELQAYYLAKNKSLKDFDKNKAKYLDELSKDKFSQVANYLLRQLTSQLEIKSYLEQREQGK
ncbi:MAG: SurA N-terminal domain-containing protein [Elusimicrobiales bacterium]|jgi:hypothetical protein